MKFELKAKDEKLRFPVVDEVLYEQDMARKSKYELIWDYVLQDGEEHPVAIICPGGAYFNVCSYVEGKPFAQYLNSRGISAVIVYYRVFEEAKYPNPQDDLARAVSTVMERAEELHLDMTNYSVWGSSAGGHLVSSFGTDNMGYAKYGLPKPASLVLIYPVISMKPGITHPDTMHNLLGIAGEEEEATVKDMIMFASVEEHITSDYPPTFVWCGESDSVVPPTNTRLCADALKKAGVDYECNIYPGVDHGVGLAYDTSAEGWIDRAVEFWVNR